MLDALESDQWGTDWAPQGSPVLVLEAVGPDEVEFTDTTGGTAGSRTGPLPRTSSRWELVIETFSLSTTSFSIRKQRSSNISSSGSGSMMLTGGGGGGGFVEDVEAWDLEGIVWNEFGIMVKVVVVWGKNKRNYDIWSLECILEKERIEKRFQSKSKEKNEKKTRKWAILGPKFKIRCGLNTKSTKTVTLWWYISGFRVSLINVWFTVI